jgi:hypothetical protein
MSIDAPKIDCGTAAKISARLTGAPGKRGLLERYTTDPSYKFDPWKEYDPVTFEPRDRSAALIGIFARFGEIVIERLNRVPEKNFLAFLDLLGAAREPPQPARVPLTFSLAGGAAGEALVPRGTQVAAPPAAGETNPVVFETERPLVVTAAQLSSLLTLDPEQDSYGDWSDRLAAPSAFTVFQGDRPLEHVLYLGDGLLLGFDAITDVKLSVVLAEPLPADAEDRTTQWECWDGTQWQVLTPLDSTDHLKHAGTVHFGAIPSLPEALVASRSGRWLRCSLMTPITQSPLAKIGMVRETRLPKIGQLVVTAHVERTFADGLAPDLGFVNAAPLDASKDCFPFGEKPRLHDTLYLASTEAFSKDQSASGSDSSAQVSLEMQLANSHLLPAAASVRPSRDLALVWELWTGNSWQQVGASGAPPWLSLLELDPTPQLVTDGTGESAVTSAILQGTAQLGARVTSQVLPADPHTPPRLLSLGGDGTFADKRIVKNGVSVFEFSAEHPADRGNPRKNWVVVLRSVNDAAPIAELIVPVPELPLDAASVALAVRVTSNANVSVTKFRVTNGTTAASVDQAASPVRVTLAEGRNDLLVEAFDAGGARVAAAAVTVSRRAAAPALDAGGFSDGTFGFTQGGVLTLRLPRTTAKTAVNGEENFWLRVRLVRGDYGKEAGYVLKDPLKPGDGFNLVPSSFRPPIVASVKIGYVFEARRSPELCLTYNQLDFTDRSPTAVADAGAFAPFVAVTESERPGLYLGFSLPPGRAFPNSTISLYSRSPESRYGERNAPLSPATSRGVGSTGTTVTHSFTIVNAAEHPDNFETVVFGHRWPTTPVGSVAVEAGATRELAVVVSIPAGAQSGESDAGFLRLTGQSGRVYSAVFATGVDALRGSAPPDTLWQYWNGKEWSKLVVLDGAGKFTRSGLVEFLAPADLAPRDLFGRSRYWLRVQLDKGEYAVPPRVSGILLNTTTAVQASTVANEILGSSNGAERQQFRSRRIPVLAGQRLEVREPAMPGAEDLAVLENEEGGDAVNVVLDAAGRPREIWVRWHEVADFYGSGPRDRHYVIDHLTGEIGFGDGVNASIPPVGTGNLRLARYQAGGGTRGNYSAGAIAQLKTTIPYVETVINQDPAAGGAEAETIDALIERVPRTLRHRDRAVTLEDYEDLARAASPEVARSLCVPLRDLAADPLGAKPMPGAVTVVLVPRTSGVKPLPTLELLARVGDFLASRVDATASVAVVGPLYLRIDLELEVAVATPDVANVVERAVHDRLAAFLHPLTGGLDGSGWDFGRAPHRSDFFALIESVPGVDHVHYLNIVETEDQPGVRQTGRFLVFSGRHQISVTFVES